jgi:hypothetical protein
MATEKAQTLSTLRTKILGESMQNEGRNRFGMFSYPRAGVWGDGDYNFSKAKHLGSDGKPITKPRGLYSGPTRTGKTESSYFARGAYVSIGDKFIDPASIERQYQLSKKKKIPHDAEFKPANGPKSDPYNALYKHMADFTEKKKNFKGPDGRVIVPPRNIVTNPPKTGHGDSTVGHLLNKHYPHQADPYDRKRELEFKERQAAKKKLQEAPFKSVCHGDKNFATFKQQFGKDEKVLGPGKPRAQTPPAKLHEAAFRPANPARQGYNKTINKFPEYKPDPIRMAKRVIEDPSKKKDPYRPNNTAFNERPTPSISLNRLNLKNEMTRVSDNYM